jgi:hypothetical protein
LGRKALAEIATIAKPDTILAWHRQFVTQQRDGSKPHTSVGRPRTAPELEALVVRMARENRSWGYDRIVGALAGPVATAVAASQCLRGALGEVGQGRMSVAAYPVRGSVTPPCADTVCGAFSSRAVVIPTRRVLSDRVLWATAPARPSAALSNPQGASLLSPAASSNSSYVSCGQSLCGSCLSTPARHIRSYPFCSRSFCISPLLAGKCAILRIADNTQKNGVMNPDYEWGRCDRP